MSSQSQDRTAELTDWIHAVGRWKTRQRKLKNLLVAIEEVLRHREEVMEEALWMAATARTSAEHEEADRALSETLARAQKDHREALRKLADLFETLDATEMTGHFERPAGLTSTQLEDPVDEASRESFPASDPPSFNPGRA